jgi:uncharacterized protein
MTAIPNFFHGTEIVEVDTGAEPILTVESSTVGVVVTAGKGPVNVPTLIRNRTEAETVFGAFKNDGFTAGSTFDSIFDQVTTTIVAVNVCDPDTHTDTISNEEVILDSSGKGTLDKGYISSVIVDSTIKVTKTFINAVGGTITLPTGITSVTSVKSADGTVTYTLGDDYSVTSNVITNLDADIAQGASVLVEYEAVLVADTDFEVSDADNGEISLLSNSKIAAQSTILVNYTHVDPTAVIIDDIKGSNVGENTGVYALLDSEALTTYIPRIIAVPGWTHQRVGDAKNVVIAELTGENGVHILQQLKAILYADVGDESSTYDQAVTSVNIVDDRYVIACWPFVKYVDPDGNISTRPQSGIWAGLTSKSDNANNPGGYRFSPSNQVVKGVVGLAASVDAGLGNPNSTANKLNSNRICTIIRRGANFKTWGNRTTYTGSIYSFIQANRIYDNCNESVQRAQEWAVDKNITHEFAEEVLEQVNAYLRQLMSQGVIIKGKCYIDSINTTAAEIAQGKFYFNLEITPPTPAERIIFNSFLDRNYSIQDLST